jgi:CHAT domain-containing protein/Tfp pilus assembly protein PilF
MSFEFKINNEIYKKYIFWIVISIFSISTSAISSISGQENRKSFSELLCKAEVLRQNGLYEEIDHLLTEFEKYGINGLSIPEKITFDFQKGSMSWILGNPSKAVEYFTKMMTFAKLNSDSESLYLSEKVIKIIDLYSSGKELRSKGDHQGSIAAFNKAIEISRSIQRIEFEMKCLRQMSINYLENNNLVDYLRCNELSLKMAHKIHYLKDEGYCLNNIGLYYYKTRNYSKAMNYYENSIKIAKRIHNLKAKSEGLTNIGILYKTIGDYDKSLKYYYEALEIDKLLGEFEYVSIDLSNIGTVYRKIWLETNSRKDLSEAFSILKECYSIVNTGNQDSVKARVANNLGTISFDLQEYSKSLEYYRQGMELANRLNDKEAISLITKNIGSSLFRMGNDEDALIYLRKAIDLAVEINAGHILWEALLETADIQKRKGCFEDALKSYQEAIDTIEKSRSTIDDEDLKTSFLRSNRRLEVYHNAIDLLYRMNQINRAARNVELAFQYMERAKARGFLDSLEIGRVSVAQKSNPEVEAKAREIQSRLARLSRESFYEPESSERRAAIEKEIQVQEDEYEELRRNIRSRDPIYSGLRFPEIMTLRALRKKILDTETVVFTYALGKEAAFGLAISREKETFFRLPSTEALRDLVADYLKTISDREHPMTGSGNNLYQTLLLPGIDRLYRRMIIVPDDVLHYLPFETLGPSGVSSWIGNEADVSYSSSLSSLAEIIKRADRRKLSVMDLLAVAASGGEESGARTRLAFSEKEVDDISNLYPPKKCLVLKGKNATEKALKTIHLEDYKMIHFAAHGLIDEQKPVRSAIVLSADPDSDEDGYFQAREIYNLRLNAEIVALSACRSAAGRMIRGEGIEGLNRSFLFAGSSAVLMSLWPVDDEATGHLMRRFYLHLREGDSLAAALRLAKTEMIGSADFSHPYYWGGFVVSGFADRRLYRKTRWWPLAAIGSAVFLAAGLWFAKVRGGVHRPRPVERRIS